ncbi:MAG: hypothetical protein QM703_23845 [Gemmatales bacterium]
MLRLTGWFLIRCRWPLIVALATMVFLFFSLQPRPLAEYRLQNKELLRFTNGADFQISPSGMYVLIFNYNSTLHLYRLNNMEFIFKHRCIDKTVCGFDADDGLAFASYGSFGKDEDDSIVECWHWQPDQSSPQKLGLCKAFPTGLRHSGSWHGDRFNRMAGFDGQTLNCLLSPDTKTWLLPSHNEKTFHFDLVDSSSGQVRARLERPDISTGTSHTNGIQFAFSANSNKLLAQTDLRDPEQYPEKKHTLECFDTQTGKQLPIGKLPEDAKLGRLCQWDNDRLVGLDVNKNMLTMQWLTKDKGYRLSPLPETMPSSSETSWGSNADFLWEAHIESLSFRVQAEKDKVVYCWEHVLYPKRGGLGGLPPYLHGYHYAARDLKTGYLLHTEMLIHPQKKEDDMMPTGWSLLAFSLITSCCLDNPTWNSSPGRKNSNLGAISM